MKKYQVIGGQYESIWYGESDTLRGAKCIATRNAEYWDNYKGWTKPDIYLAEDVEKTKSGNHIPAQYAVPVCCNGVAL